MTQRFKMAAVVSLVVLASCSTHRSMQHDKSNASGIGSTAMIISCGDIVAVQHTNNVHGVIILGQLGLPMGSVVRIEGVGPDGAAKFDPTTHLLVESVDGKTLVEPCMISLRYEQRVQPSKRCILIGYESGGFQDEPYAVAKHYEKVPQNYHFSFRTEFYVIKDLTPTSNFGGKVNDSQKYPQLATTTNGPTDGSHRQ